MYLQCSESNGFNLKFIDNHLPKTNQWNIPGQSRIIQLPKLGTEMSRDIPGIFQWLVLGSWLAMTFKVNPFDLLAGI